MPRIDNSQCDFDIELYDGVPGQAFSHEAFTLFQPFIVADDIRTPDIKTVVADGRIIVNSFDESIGGRIYKVNVRYVSKRYIMRKYFVDYFF